MNSDPIIRELYSLKKYVEIVDSRFISNHLKGKCEKGWIRNRDPDKDYYLWEYYPIIDMQSISLPSIAVKDEYLKDFLNSYKEVYKWFEDPYKEQYNDNRAPTENDKLWLNQKISEWRKNVISDYSRDEHIRRLVWSLGDKYNDASRSTLEANAQLFISPDRHINFNEFHSQGMCFEIIGRSSHSVCVRLKSIDGLWGGYPNYGRHEPILNNTSSLRIPDKFYREGLGECYISQIGSGVFDYLTKVENLYLPSISKIEWSLWDCFLLKNIYIDYSYSGWNNYRTIDGVLFSGDAKTLIAYPNKHGEEYEVPSGVERIHNKAFKDCIDLRLLKLPATLKSIGLNAFYRCENLKQIIVDNVEGSINYEGLFGNYGEVNPEWSWIRNKNQIDNM